MGVELRDFDARDGSRVRALLEELGWTPEQIEGQIEALRTLKPRRSGFAMVATDDGDPVGFVSALAHSWNRLTQIHGLAVSRQKMRQGTASRLVAAAEDFARFHGARGVYVDTPADNEVARAFYLAIGYAEAYVMPRYYSDEKDGVTFTKFFV